MLLRAFTGSPEQDAVSRTDCVLKYYFAKTANWVKDGVPAQSADTPSAQLVLHPVSITIIRRCLHEISPGGIPPLAGLSVQAP